MIGSVTNVAESLARWLLKMFRGLPTRTLPLMGLDANARVGSIKSFCIGDADVSNETDQGALFRELLEQVGCLAMNTYTPNPPTFYSGTSNWT